MKTVFIYELIPEELKFFVVDGNYSELNNVYINEVRQDEVKTQILHDLIYDDEGNVLVEYSNDFPIDIVKNEDCIVIRCGFYL